MALEGLELSSAALLVIDMQNAFCHEEGTLGVSGVDTAPMRAIVPALSRLIERCDAAKVPVLWTVQEHFASDASRARKRLAAHTARRKQIAALAGTWDAEIIEEMKAPAARNPSWVIRKHRFGAFHETRLDMLLRQLGTRTLLVTGATTNACVETSIREAYLRDFDVVAVTDCIAGVRPEWERVAQDVWRQYFCVTADSAEVLAWIDAESAPRARAFGHLLLLVEDVERSRRFYVELLGFGERPAKPLADGRPFVAFHQGIAITAGRAPGHRQVDHMAFSVTGVRGLRDRLKAAGVPFFQDLHDGPYGLTVYVADPDGNKIELFEAA
jgi:ureidoacrylate peracid hydrolase